MKVKEGALTGEIYSTRGIGTSIDGFTATLEQDLSRAVRTETLELQLHDGSLSVNARRVHTQPKGVVHRFRLPGPVQLQLGLPTLYEDRAGRS
jgi:hypothetical protein